MTVRPRLALRGLTTVSAAVLMFGALGAGVAHADGPESEPNGTTATASALDPAGACYATATGSINPGDDVDYWAVPTTAGQRVWTMTDTGGTQNAGANSRDTVLDFLAPDGTTVIENDDDDGTGNGGDGTIETGLASVIAGKAAPSTGTSYLKVNAFVSTAIIDPYRIFFATSSATVQESASNDTAATAMAAPNCHTAVTASIGTSGDADYYKFTLAAGERLIFAADADPERDASGTDLVLEVHDSADALVLSVDSSIYGSLNNPAAEGANFVAPSAGTYYLKVQDFSALETGNYDLLIAKESGYVTGLAPTITGLAKVGQTLTADEGPVVPADASLSYVWKANGNPIANATGSTYKLKPAQAGKTITVTITASKPPLTPETETSAPTATVREKVDGDELKLDRSTATAGGSLGLLGKGLVPGQLYHAAIGSISLGNFTADQYGEINQTVFISNSVKNGLQIVTITSPTGNVASAVVLIK